MAHKLILEAKKEIVFISNKIFSKCVIYNNFKSNQMTTYSVDLEEKIEKKVSTLLNIDCCLLCLAR